MKRMGIRAIRAKYLGETEVGISLAIYRISFGLLMCFSLLRFYYKGWIEACYLSTPYHFTYQYFHWVQPILYPEWVMYALVFLGAFLALLVALGLWYRWSIALFFILFSYLELIEQSWYLNHYYFVSIVAFLLIFIPANQCFSLDRLLGKVRSVSVNKLFANLLRFQISLVYFFAGLAKINADWLLEAMPLKIWLKAKIDISIIGPFLAYDWTAYLFSYSGMFYDLLIPFFLWNSRTRPLALIAVVVFHVMTAVLFNIGLFPWIMIVGSLIFVQDEEWQRLFSFFKMDYLLAFVNKTRVNQTLPKWLLIVFMLHFSLQIVLPARRFFYLENQKWTERHYRFAWNVMLAEKGGSALFKIKESASGRSWTAYPSTHLSVIQEKQMSYQADMIWQYAQYLKQVYQDKGLKDFSITVECWVAFNGRPSQLYLPTDLDLLSVSEDEIYDYVLNPRMED
ncbi:MAG: HTTM domain-containing protein [Bacteroidota bacterium]